MRPLFAILLLSNLAYAQDWTWRGTSPLNEARSEACIQRLTDGRVLVTGGQGQSPLASVEIFQTQPEEQFTAAGSMQSARAGHGCTLLSDGRVLVAGGGGSGIEIYEPSLDTWTLIESTVPRGAGTFALRLIDGRILITGGGSAKLEVYDSGSGELTLLAGNLQVAREKHTVTLLRDGRVLIAGGVGPEGVLASAEIFDPETSEVQSAPAMANPRSGHTATLLLDGRVLLAGGTNGKEEWNTLEVYLPDTNRFEVLSAALKNARQNHTGLLVETNGTVLLAGGSLAGEPLATTELFDPVENQVLEAGSLTASRTGIAGVMLEDGSVLGAGGRNSQGASRACGVITSSTLRFTQTVYRPLERATISGNFNPSGLNGQVTLELTRISSNGQTTAFNSRLLVSTANITNGVLPLTAVMNVFREDIGNEFLLTAKAKTPTGATVSLQARFAAKLRTSLQLTVPGGISIVGQRVVANLQLTADGSPTGFSGTITLRAGAITIPSNVLQRSATVVSNSVEICCNLPEGVIPVTASFSGNAALEPSDAPSLFHLVVSKTPAVALSLPALSLGTPATLTAFVSIQAASTSLVQQVDPSLRPTGTITVRKNTGETIGTATLVPPTGFSTTPLPGAQAQIVFTPGITDRRARQVCFETAYSGDARYASVGFGTPTSGPLLTVSGSCAAIGAATPRLTLLAGPATYVLGTPSRFSVRLTWPDSVGIVSRTVNVMSNGFARGTITLTPNPNGLGIAEGTGDVTLPFDTKSLTFVYAASGDLDTAQATATIAMNRIVTTLTTTLRNPITNPFAIPYTLGLSTGGQPLPPGVSVGGSVEFRDGTTLLGTLPVASLAPGPGITDGSSNTIILSEVRQTGALTNVIRPTGQRTITLRFTGSALFAESQTSATVTIP